MGLPVKGRLIFVCAILWLMFISAGQAYAQTSQETRFWYSLEEARQLAENDGKYLFIFGKAAWCVYCKKMEAEVFPADKIREVMHRNFYPVKLDIESNRAVTFNDTQMTEAQFAEKASIRILPAFVVLNAEGEMIVPPQTGFFDEDALQQILLCIGEGECG